MAEKKQPKIILEREYNVPLRRKWLLVPKYKRAKKAIATLREFISRHMKSDDVLIGRYLNMAIWKDGIKNPPHHVLVIAKKDEEGTVKVELKSAPVEKETKETKDKKTDNKEKSEKVTEVEEENIQDAVEVQEKDSEKKIKDTEENNTKEETKPEEKIEEKKESKKTEKPKSNDESKKKEE